MPVAKVSATSIRSLKKIWNLFKEAADTLQRITFILALVSIAYPSILEWIFAQSQSPQAEALRKVAQAIRESPWSPFSQMILIVAFLLGLLGLLISVVLSVFTKRGEKLPAA